MRPARRDIPLSTLGAHCSLLAKRQAVPPSTPLILPSPLHAESARSRAPASQSRPCTVAGRDTLGRCNPCPQIPHTPGGPPRQAARCMAAHVMLWVRHVPQLLENLRSLHRLFGALPDFRLGGCSREGSDRGSVFFGRCVTTVQHWAVLMPKCVSVRCWGMCDSGRQERRRERRARQRRCDLPSECFRPLFQGCLPRLASLMRFRRSSSASLGSACCSGTAAGGAGHNYDMRPPT